MSQTNMKTWCSSMSRRSVSCFQVLTDVVIFDIVDGTVATGIANHVSKYTI